MRNLSLVLVVSLLAPAAAAAPAVQTSPKATKPLAKPSKPITVKKVADLTAAERLAAMIAAFNAQITENQLLTPTTFSVRKPWVDEHTWMGFYLSYTVDPNKNRAILGKWEYPEIHFRSAADTGYFVECKVSIDYKVSKLSVYAVSAPPGSDSWTDMKELLSSDVNVSNHHVTFALQPNGLRDVSFALYRGTDSWWDFQSCKITPVKL